MSTNSQKKDVTKADLTISDQPHLYVDGVGWLDQYGSYCDKLYSHGVIYFVRDYYTTQLLTCLNHKLPYTHWEAKLAAINSKIAEYEQYGQPN